MTRELLLYVESNASAEVDRRSAKAHLSHAKPPAAFQRLQHEQATRILALGQAITSLYQLHARKWARGREGRERVEFVDREDILLQLVKLLGDF